MNKIPSKRVKRKCFFLKSFTSFRVQMYFSIEKSIWDFPQKNILATIAQSAKIWNNIHKQSAALHAH